MTAFHKLRLIVGDTLAVDPQKIHDTTLLSDLGANDMDKHEIMIGVENVFGIEIDDETRDGIKTFGDLKALIEKVSS